jgi:hypothetical protein
LIVDEFSSLASGTSMAGRVEQARGFHTSLILAPQVVAGMGDEEQAELGQRERFMGDDDLVFAGVVGDTSTRTSCEPPTTTRLSAPGCAACASTTCVTPSGTRAVEKAESILELKEWMGHANVQTTMRYLHYKSKADAARRLSEAFTEEGEPDPGPVPTTACT